MSPNRMPQPGACTSGSGSGSIAVSMKGRRRADGEMGSSWQMNRRTFLSLGAVGALGLTSRGRLAAAQNQPAVQSPPAAQTLDQIPVAGDDIPLGKSRLGIADGERDGTVYVPQSYKKGVPMPIVMMLHGFRSTAE